MKISKNTNNYFRVWKTIKIGTYNSVEDFKKALLENGFRIGDWALDVLESKAFKLAKQKSKLDLVRITPSDLGFKDGAYRKDIYRRAKEIGLKLCLLEVGPQLRLQYTNQPRLESLQIGMKSQKDREDHESQFRVVHAVDDHLWLVGDHKHPDDFWKEDEYFIFVK